MTLTEQILDRRFDNALVNLRRADGFWSALKPGWERLHHVPHGVRRHIEDVKMDASSGSGSQIGDSIFDGKSVLITGGTGSFGRKYVDTLINRTKVPLVINIAGQLSH